MVSRLDNVYRRVLRPLLFKVPEETAQRLVLVSLQYLIACAPKRFLVPDGDPAELHTSVYGLDFLNPVGLGAGLDKNARAAFAWQALGFGFAEHGTITPKWQKGNAQPRLWRLPEQRALVNRLGFPSKGADWVARRLEYFRKSGIQIPLGLNFGPNKDTPTELVKEDYSALMSRLGHLADFIVINLSSPNTAGLREFQAPDRMRTVVGAVRDVKIGELRTLPLLIKLAPDLEAPMLAEICAAAVDLGLDGIVATNTTLKREGLRVRFDKEGGLSGQPLKARAREVIAQIYTHTSGRIPIIGVGGIASAEDAYEHIRCGASLVEFCTGLVYEGPGLPRRIKEGLVALLKRDGFRSISEAVGSGVLQANSQRSRKVAQVA
jgi:dihydroorotate dehydrogenase